MALIVPLNQTEAYRRQFRENRRHGNWKQATWEGHSLMAIKQRSTPFDELLLRAAFPLLFSLGLRNWPGRGHLWHIGPRKMDESKVARAPLAMGRGLPIRTLRTVPTLVRKRAA